MSYNIDTVHYVGDGRLSIRRGDAVGFAVAFEDELPEGNIFHRLNLDGEPNEILMIEDFWWYGDGSGSLYGETLVPKLLPITTGYAELVFIWEGGDSITGLEVNNGVVTNKDVEFLLVDPEDD